MGHLDIFQDLIAAISMDGVPEDYLLCKLFKHSLVGEASHWLKQLPPGSLTSWTDIQKAFLREFFGEARAQEIRDKIWTFSQGPTKAFKRSLERFMRYQS